MGSEFEVVGLIPAAGRASRLAPLAASKELFPIGLRPTATGVRPLVVSQLLMEQLRSAGIDRTYVVLREGKWDIAAYFGDGVDMTGMHIGYLVASVPHGPAFTLDAAYPFVRNNIVATGFPDMYFWPNNMISRLVSYLQHTNADAVMGLIPAKDPLSQERLQVDQMGQVTDFRMEASDNRLPYSWAAAVWSPVFTEFLHGHLATELASGRPYENEVHVGMPLYAAFLAGLNLHGLVFEDGGYLDFGRTETLDMLYQGTIDVPGFAKQTILGVRQSSTTEL